jgi:hypothetical protein
MASAHLFEEHRVNGTLSWHGAIAAGMDQFVNAAMVEKVSRLGCLEIVEIRLIKVDPAKTVNLCLASCC